MFERSGRAHRHGRRDRVTAQALEPRVMLDTAPLPSLDALESPSNPVVRLETALGDIDIELLPQAAPGLVDEFLANVTRYSLSAFSRSVPGDILQAGLVLDPTFYSNIGRFQRLDTAETAQRPNAARTLARVNFGGVAGSVTPEFYFNLVDNPELDTGPNAGTVFARVVDDRSWAVVEQIAALPTADLDGLFLDPSVFSGPGIDVQGPLDDVPTRPGVFNPEQPLADQNAFVLITDAQAIKPAGVGPFFVQRLYYPEGFIGGPDINEFVPIGNPNAQGANFQVVLRRERTPAPGLPRDLVVASELLGANARGGVDLTTAIRALGVTTFAGEPYAVEIHATRQLTANMSHFDFGTATGEAFTDAPGTTWSFAEAQTGEGLPAFLVWQNTSGVPAVVTVTFYTGGGTTSEITVFTPAHQRGGLSLAELPDVPAGRFGIRLTANQPVVAALTRFDTRGTGGNDSFGSTELGVPGEGAADGLLPLAGFAPAGDETASADSDRSTVIDFLNTGEMAASVTVVARGVSGAAPVVRQVTVGARDTARFEFGTLRDLIGSDAFSVVYISDQPVVVGSRHFEKGDVTATGFSPVGAAAWAFAEGFMDANRAGADLFETLAITNTSADGEAGVAVTFLFSDGTTATESFSIESFETLVLDLHTFEPLLTQARAGRNFYSIQIVADRPVATQMRRYDLTLGGDNPAGGFETLGDPFGTLTTLDFDPPT